MDSHAAWRKSSRSGQKSSCVEVAKFTDHTLVRDTKNRAGGTLHFTTNAWSNFLRSLKAER